VEEQVPCLQVINARVNQVVIYPIISVLVDELARWKASLMHRAEETDHRVRLALNEHSLLR